MKAPKKVVFSFNPDEAGIPALTDRVGKILWGCIRTQHIVNQYFNGNVQSVALRVAEKKPEDYEAFKRIINSSELDTFGTNWIGGGFRGHMELDDEFWKDVWSYINHEKRLVYEVKL